jgi:hypothetical protein
MSDDERSLNELEAEDDLSLAVDAEWYAAGYISLLVKGVERGDTPIGISLSAWENTMCVVEWALRKHVTGHLQGPSDITTEDVVRMRRLRALGAAIITDGEDEPDLPMLAERCLEALLGPKWKTYQRRVEIDACRLLDMWSRRPASAAPSRRGATQEELDNELDFLIQAEYRTVDLIGTLVDALDRGDDDLGIDPTAWSNTMAAVHWAMGEHVAGRVWSRRAITVEDIERMKRLESAVSSALAGCERTPELRALACRGAESLLGPNWRRVG